MSPLSLMKASTAMDDEKEERSVEFKRFCDEIVFFCYAILVVAAIVAVTITAVLLW